MAIGSLFALDSGVAADPVTLRVAALGPDGSSWARDMRSLGRRIDADTNGAVHMKFYFGGIAGDEPSALERVRRGQLDGLAGASVCEQLAPSLALMRVVGLFQSRNEAIYILGRLKPQLDEEFRRSGFVDLANSVFGADQIFTRRPVHRLADLMALRWWGWSTLAKQRPIWEATITHLGGRVLTTSIDQLAPAYQRGDIDAFIAPPSAVLAYQWSTLVPYFLPLTTAMLPGCLVITNAAMDQLPPELQQELRAAGATFQVHWDEASAALDQALMDQLFEKQGMKKIPVSPELRAEFLGAARQVREQLGDKLVPSALLARAMELLADYRAQYPANR